MVNRTHCQEQTRYPISAKTQYKTYQVFLVQYIPKSEIESLKSGILQKRED